MKPFEALDSNRATIREVVASHRACNARVFDSLLRGKGTDGSDLDILIGPRPQTTLMDAGAIQVELQRLIGVSVNVLPLRFCQISFAMQFCQKRRPVDPDTRRARNIGLIQRHPAMRNVTQVSRRLHQHVNPDIFARTARQAPGSGPVNLPHPTKNAPRPSRGNGDCLSTRILYEPDIGDLDMAPTSTKDAHQRQIHHFGCAPR